MYVLEDGNGTVVTYPITFEMVRAQHPHISIPRDPAKWAAFNVYPVQATAQPAYNAMTQRVVEATPVKGGGVWSQAWSVQALSAEQIAAKQKAAAQQAVEDAAKADAFIQQFVQYDAAQVQAYVDSNVTDLASARAVLKKLALICLALAKTRLS